MEKGEYKKQMEKGENCNVKWLINASSQFFFVLPTALEAAAEPQTEQPTAYPGCSPNS